MVISVQVLGKYMIIGYLDPEDSGFSMTGPVVFAALMGMESAYPPSL